MSPYRKNRLAAWAALLLLVVSPASLFADDDARDLEVPTTGKPRTGPQVYGWDNGTQRAARVDDNRRVRVYDGSKSEWPLTGSNLRNNQPINLEFVSAVIDARDLGTKPTLLISWPGGTQPLYVAIDFLQSSDVDSTTIFRPRIGFSSPRNLGATFRMLAAGAVASDSVTTGGALRTSYALPMYVDTLGKELGSAPYVRVHIYSNAQVDGVYAHLRGRP